MRTSLLEQQKSPSRSKEQRWSLQQHRNCDSRVGWPSSERTATRVINENKGC
jgi:hypothetical protein